LPQDISKAIAGGITDTAKGAISAAATGGDVGQAIARGAATSAAGVAGQAFERATTEPEIVRPGIEEQTPAQVAEQMGPDLYATAYPEAAPQPETPGYEGLGYTPEEIRQLEEGVYAGPEQTPAQAKEQVGALYDVAYGDVTREPSDVSGGVRQAAAPIAGYLLTPEQRSQQAGGYITPAEPTAAPQQAPTSTAYLARGALGSPEITGSPVFGTEKGKRKKVWNIESLREALGV
jgi:hypothetical protein